MPCYQTSLALATKAAIGKTVASAILASRDFTHIRNPRRARRMKIELRNVSKFYGKTRALDGVSLEINSGQVVALLGANGSGKTTLLRCLYGLATADKGFVLFDDHEFSRDDIPLRRRMFLIPDFPFLFWEMTALQHIGMTLKLYDVNRPQIEQTVVALLKEFDLLPLAERPIFSLSRGQAYKVALCALLAVDPELWILDEPLASGMDPHGLSSFKTHALEAAKRGRTVIYSTQILDVVERFSDRVCILDEGEVKGFGAVAELEKMKEGARSLEQIFNSLRESK